MFVPAIGFEFPYALALLLALFFLPKASFRWLRILSLLLLLIAIAKPFIAKPGQNLLLLIDVSDSVKNTGIAAAQEMKKKTNNRYFYFASDVSEVGLGSTVPEQLNSSQTDIARALQVAKSSDAKRVLLISDGAESIANARLALPDFPVDSFFIKSRDNISLIKVVSPELVSQGQEVEAIAVIQSDVEADVTVLATVSGTRLEPIQVKLKKGKTAVPFRFQVNSKDNFELEVSLSSEFEQPKSDDSLQTQILVNQNAPILIINDPAMARLLREQGFQIVEGDASFVKTPLNYSAVILRTSAGDFSTGQLELLKTYVNNGGGLMMTAGPKSFGFGAWYRTAVEDILPVNTDLRTKVELPLVALVIVLDRSQSMASGQPSKLDLAKEGAISVVELAYQEDLLGLLLFSDDTKWAFKLRKATDRGKREMLAAILNINSKGGTVLEPAFTEAIDRLQRTDASIKHIIILSDGKLYDGGGSAFSNGKAVDFELLASIAAKAKISTSTIAIGEGADFERLEAIAKAGGGRYYKALDVSTLPRIFTDEALTATRSLLREGSFNPKVNKHPLVSISGSAPPINAYIATTIKPKAETLISGKDGEAILALNRQGLGRSAALTTDLNSYAGYFAKWEDLPGVLGTVVRWLEANPAQYKAVVSKEGTELKVTVDAVKDGKYINGKNLELRYAGQQIGLEQIAPGRYQAYVPNSSEDSKLIISDGNEVVAKAQVDNKHNEFDTNKGQELLKDISALSGGEVISDLKNYNPQIPKDKNPIWQYFLLSAVILFLLELLLRRLPPLKIKRLKPASQK